MNLTGTGKTHLAIALGRTAIDSGYRVKFFRAVLVEQLYRGLADNTVSKVIDAILRAEVVIIDKLGCAPRGAMIPRGSRGPHLTAAAVGRS